jgi:ATP phosphoribosyltransferase-like protein
MESNTQLIANRTALGDGAKRTKLENIALLLKAAIEAQGRVGLMLNVRRADLATILTLLPALQRPTISSLSDDEWVAVNTIIEEKTVRDLIPRLKHAERRECRYPLTRSCCEATIDLSCPGPDQSCGCGAGGRAMRIIETANRAALSRVLARDRLADRSFERRVAEIVDRVRVGGDGALLGFAKRFDGVKPPLEISREEMTAAAATVPAEVRRAIRQAARNIARVAFRQIPKHWDLEVMPGVTVEQRVDTRDGSAVSRRAVPTAVSLLMTVARPGGVREIAVCPRPEPR